MQKIRWMISFAELSLFYNAIILISVTLNLHWVTSRAAGGQYESFPVLIRIIYLLMTVLTLTLMKWLWRNRSGILSGNGKRLSTWLAIIFAISTFLQLISRSSDERWNAIPASIVALTFWNLSKKN
jgi:hypothetical protein